MRKLLASEEGQRKRFQAVFIRFGKRINYKGYSEPTVLLTSVVDVETGNVVTDHLWFSFTKGFEKLNLTEGQRLEFDARVMEYNKGYVNRKYGINQQKKDFRLSHPTRISIVKNDEN